MGITRSKTIIFLIFLVSLCLADQPLVDKKTIEVKDNKIEIVTPDEVQRINTEANKRVDELSGEIKRLRLELESLKNNYQDLERRVRALE